MINHSRLELAYERGLQEGETIWLDMKFQKCQMDQLRTQTKHSLTFNLDSAVWCLGSECVHLEKTGEVVYLRRCAKMEMKIVEKKCTEEVPVRLRLGKETVLKLMDPITKVFSRNYT